MIFFTMSATLELNAWTTLPDAPLPRAGAAVGVVGAQLVVAGGTYWVDGVKCWTDQVDAFDLDKRVWRPWPSLPALRGDMAAIVQGGRFLLLGGGTQEPALSSVVAWENDTWTERTELRLPEPRRSAVAAAIADEIFVLGGLTGKGTDFHTATRTLWSARPGHGWRSRAELPAPARFGAAIGVLGGRLIVAGGCAPDSGSVRNLDDILAYDPATDRWETIGRLPVPLRGAWGLATGDRLLVIGGYTSEFRREILAVDARGGVTPAGMLPVALADARFACHGDNLYGVTGEDGVKRRFPGCLTAPLPTAK
jgi:N-acetylneuraminic acid mutarotase